ncbi:MAG: DNA damage response protein DdrC [Meiothermus sp.]|nr:DNA damage response protein DdrC [Meiothermus sp.]
MNATSHKTKSTVKLGKSHVRTTPDGRIHALEALHSLGLSGTSEELERLKREHGLRPGLYNFGGVREATLSYADYLTLAFGLDTLEARRWRGKARDLLRRYLEGDVALAAEVAERSPSPEHRRWLSARLENVESRKRFMSTVAKHGGEGHIYQQVSSLSNRSVLKMNSTDFRRTRKARNTRDGMTATELLRLSYLETATSKAIEQRRAQGNDQILRLHRQNAEIEQRLWEQVEPDKPGA